MQSFQHGRHGGHGGGVRPSNHRVTGKAQINTVTIEKQTNHTVFKMFYITNITTHILIYAYKNKSTN